MGERLYFGRAQAIELGPTGDSSSDSGVFYPLKGWGTVRDALLHAVEDSGVTCLWNTAAQEVVVQDGAARGVRVSPAAAPLANQLPTSARGAAAAADPCQEFVARQGDGAAGAGVGAESSAPPPSYTLTADCVVVNADVATAESALLPAALRRSEYVEQSELSTAAKVATASRALREVRAARTHGGPTGMGPTRCRHRPDRRRCPGRVCACGGAQERRGRGRARRR